MMKMLLRLVGTILKLKLIQTKGTAHPKLMLISVNQSDLRLTLLIVEVELSTNYSLAHCQKCQLKSKRPYHTKFLHASSRAGKLSNCKLIHIP